MSELVGNHEDRFAGDETLRTVIFEPRCKKSGLRGFRLGPTQTGLRNH